jgi:acetoacetate decarboxylase
MSKVRYAKGLRDLERTQRGLARASGDVVRRIRCIYETDAEVAQAVVPKPLEANVAAEICVSFLSIVKPLTPDVTIEVRSVQFGIRVEYDAKPGCYLLTVPMSSERAVLISRERYGEPAKMANVEFGEVTSDETCFASATRKGIRYLAATGKRVDELSARCATEYGYCFKAFPGCVPGKGFDQDPQLVRLEWDFDFTHRWRLEGGIQLVDSPFDPVADLPVRRIVEFEYAEGRLRSSGRVLRPVPGDWLTPFIHQRYDEPDVEGVDV